MALNPNCNFDLLNYVITAYSEKIPRNGEDAISYSINGKASYVGVFDGVGGSGARRYESCYHKTGAYLASRLVARKVKKWFDDGTNQSAGNTDLYLIPGSECEGTAETRLQNILQSKLRAHSEKLSSSQKIKIKSSFSQEFPTTMAAIVVVPVSGSVVKNENGPVNCQCLEDDKPDALKTGFDGNYQNISESDTIKTANISDNLNNEPAGEGNSFSYNTNFYWAGDSRGYIIDKNGLTQITKDDTNVDDELENISADGVMNNIIFNGKSDKDGNACFTIHHRMVPRTAPFIAFSATDGCFGYIPSPMEFEYYILDCLMNAESALQFESNLNDLFKHYAEDDFSFTALVYGYQNFEAMKESFNDRYKIVKDMYEYINDNELETKDRQDVRKKIWKDSYKQDYTKYINS